MKLNLLLVVLSLFVSSSIYAEEPIKLLFHFNDTEQPMEFVATTVDSITFAGVETQPDIPETPDIPEVPETPEDPDIPIIPDTPVNPENKNYENGYEYVDLALPSGTLWATMNVGAESEEDNGDYFAWGEVEPKDVFGWDNYKWCNGDSYSITKYCTTSYNGTVDGKTILDKEDDVASVLWQGNWRLPDEEELNELINECIWQWDTKSGVDGYIVKSKNNDNTIFLPASGFGISSGIKSVGVCGFYMSSVLNSAGSKGAYFLNFTSDEIYIGGDDRSVGISVRPVFSKKTVDSETSEEESN